MANFQQQMMQIPNSLTAQQQFAQVYTNESAVTPQEPSPKRGGKLSLHQA